MALLLPGDAVPEDTCTQVGNFPATLLKNPDSLHCDFNNPAVAGKLFISANKQTFIDAFDANDLKVCNDDFGTGSNNLHLWLKKKEDDEEEPPGPGNYNYYICECILSIYAISFSSNGSSVFYNGYLGMPIATPWTLSNNPGYSINITNNVSCPHNKSAGGTILLCQPSNKRLVFAGGAHIYPDEFKVIAIGLAYCCNFSISYTVSDPDNLRFHLDANSVLLRLLNPEPYWFWIAKNEYNTLIQYDLVFQNWAGQLQPCSAEEILSKTFIARITSGSGVAVGQYPY